MTNVTANHQIDEKLDWISQAPTLDEQVTRTKQVAELDATFLPLMRMAVIETEKLCNIADSREFARTFANGMTANYNPTPIPDDTPLTTVRQEYRRLSKFVSGGSYAETTSVRREEIWENIVDGLHSRERNILTHIKDQTLLVIYPNMREVLTQFGMLIPVPLKEDTVAPTVETLPVSANPSKKKNVKKAPKPPKTHKSLKAPKASKVSDAVEVPNAKKLPWFKTILK